MVERVESVVVGAGVVGLAIARALAVSGRDVLVLEAERSIGTHASSRNNEVMHAGFVHPPGSLRASLGLRGREMLRLYCADRDIGCRMIGKLIPATNEEELVVLNLLRGHADEIGINGVELIDGLEARRLESNLHCLAAIHSRSTGIVDSHGLMLSYQGDLEDHGGIVAFRSRVRGGRALEPGFSLDVATGDAESYELLCDILINAAGLGAQELARRLVGFPGPVPRLYLAKGSFFSSSKLNLFSRLIQPVGRTREMGGAYTLDLAGQGRFGPNFELVERIDYRVNADHAITMAEGVRRYYPPLAASDLQPSYAGIRPRLDDRAATAKDWIIQGPRDHNIPNLVNLFGVDSPGLTSSLAIGEFVVGLIG